MQKLFAALRDLHPGYEVVDVRFLTSRDKATDMSVAELDDALAYAVSNAHDLEPASVG